MPFRRIYEYKRPAASAISEFAPFNTFYANGHHLKIDQIDVQTTEIENWRLCPDCSYSENTAGQPNKSVCPKCGSSEWSDYGQKRKMLKVKMVYSNDSYENSLINDSSDDRNNVFYCKQLLVNIDENNKKDIIAYEMRNNTYTFGYEYIKKANLKEINFGEMEMNGETLRVAGREEVRKGFKICTYCGKLQPKDNKKRSVHTRYCTGRKDNDKSDAEIYEDCLFLYREINTEILRILIPVTTEDLDDKRRESFIAAFMFGMKLYFGNVDHLKAAVIEEPVPEGGYSKQYLVIYDTVPGGTGYLKQLIMKDNAMVEVLEKALYALESCNCHKEIDVYGNAKDGCYHCLYAYRQGRGNSNISRTTAIEIFKEILAGKNTKKRIDVISMIDTNPLFDSELERLFVEALGKFSNDNRNTELHRDFRNGKECYILTITNKENFKRITWSVEPQVELDASQGICVRCKPDFIITSLSKSNVKPVAIFTDGFTFHKDKVEDDVLKREAVRRSKNFYVWSLSTNDVKTVFSEINDFATNTLDYTKMPNYTANSPLVKNISFDIRKETAMSLLIMYLENPDHATESFKKIAKSYSMLLLSSRNSKSKQYFDEFSYNFNRINEVIDFCNKDFNFNQSIIGIYHPLNDDNCFNVYSGIRVDDYKANTNNPKVAMIAELNDLNGQYYECYKSEWNGFWHFWNIMQFNNGFVGITKKGVLNKIYSLWRSDIFEVTSQLEDNPWQSVLELVFDETSIKIVNILKEWQVEVPDMVGQDIDIHGNGCDLNIELGWSDKKICYVTEDYEQYISELEHDGWTILNICNLENIFGGDN